MREKSTDSLSQFPGVYICDYSFPRSMLLLRFGSIAASIIHIIACMGAVGCLGCDINRKLISSVDEPLKGQKKFNARTVEKPSISEDFWTNSNFDMDYSAFQSRGSISSISTSTLDASSSGNWNLPSEFVNHGLLLWNQTRQLWVGNKKYPAQQLCEPRLSWNATYESLVGSNKPFTKPIPLAEMIDFLVDVWEQEGIND